MACRSLVCAGEGTMHVCCPPTHVQLQCGVAAIICTICLVCAVLQPGADSCRSPGLEPEWRCGGTGAAPVPCCVALLPARPAAAHACRYNGVTPAPLHSQGLVAAEEEFSAITDKIPQRPVTVTEAGGYSLVIVAALGVSGLQICRIEL